MALSGSPVSAGADVAAYKWLRDECERMLTSLPTSIEEDEATIAAATEGNRAQSGDRAQQMVTANSSSSNRLSSRSSACASVDSCDCSVGGSCCGECKQSYDPQHPRLPCPSTARATHVQAGAPLCGAAVALDEKALLALRFRLGHKQLLAAAIVQAERNMATAAAEGAAVVAGQR